MSSVSSLAFLCETLEKCRVQARTVYPRDLYQPTHAQSAQTLTVSLPHLSEDVTELLDGTLYKLTDPFRRTFFLLRLPNDTEGRVLCIGPYFSVPPTEAELLELGEQNGLSPKQQSALREYMGAIPLLESDSPLFIMIHTFCEQLWETPAFPILDLDPPAPLPSTVDTGAEAEGIQEELLEIKTMEQRYSFENQLIRAVTLGQLHMEGQLLTAFSGEVFERRIADPLRNAKNYCIIMNTLLRKAAENGGVHPVHIDRLSSELAKRIEQIQSISSVNGMMGDIFRAYCRLVRKHSVQKYSLAVQKAILLIDLKLAEDISPSEIAGALGISLGYLSAVFHRETGKTLTEHIRERRIDHAKHLLKTTELQIQTVALHCGILDVQYFSRIFKRQTGKTPREYRESRRKGNTQA